MFGQGTGETTPMDATTTAIENRKTITPGYEDLTTAKGETAEIGRETETNTAVMRGIGISNDETAAIVTTDRDPLQLLEHLLRLRHPPLRLQLPHRHLSPLLSRQALLPCPTPRT